MMPLHRPDARPEPLKHCAAPHSLALALAAILCGTSPSCDSGEPEPAGGVVGGIPRDASGIPLDREIAPVGEESRRQIASLIESLMPLDPTLTSDHHDRQFIKNQKWVKRLMRGEKEIGEAALHAYTGFQGEEYLVRRGLLTVGAHAAPEVARPILAELMMQYGYRIGDRTEAALLLAETSPETYLELATPLLQRRGRAEATMPPDEFLVRGYAAACEITGKSPVQILADVVTNLAMEDAARHFAAEELGKYPGDPFGEAALKTAMVESTGNGYLRRKAAQSLRDSLPGERGAAFFSEVVEREVDLNFKRFLEDLISTSYR